MSVYNFRSIDDFPGYAVTECGRVYSSASSKFLAPRSASGYQLVTLGGRNGKQISVHVLVATAFIGPRPTGMVVNHKNGIRTDNHANNLEWVTQSENVSHAYKTGLRTIDQKHRERCAVLGAARRRTTAEIDAKIKDSYRGKRGDIERLAQEYGVSRYVVSRVLEGVTS